VVFAILLSKTGSGSVIVESTGSETVHSLVLPLYLMVLTLMIMV